jgi:hypothetical protein
MMRRREFRRGSVAGGGTLAAARPDAAHRHTPACDCGGYRRTSPALGNGRFLSDDATPRFGEVLAQLDHVRAMLGQEAVGSPGSPRRPAGRGRGSTASRMIRRARKPALAAWGL